MNKKDDILSRIKKLNAPMFVDRHISDLLDEAYEEILTLRSKADPTDATECAPSALDGPWSSGYVRKLGVHEHCEEILTIEDSLRALMLTDTAEESDKNRREGALLRSLDNECADLFLILHKWSYNRKELLNERAKKLQEDIRA